MFISQLKHITIFLLNSLWLYHRTTLKTLAPGFSELDRSPQIFWSDYLLCKCSRHLVKFYPFAYPHFSNQPAITGMFTRIMYDNSPLHTRVKYQLVIHGLKSPSPTVSSTRKQRVISAIAPDGIGNTCGAGAA